MQCTAFAGQQHELMFAVVHAGSHNYVCATGSPCGVVILALVLDTSLLEVRCRIQTAKLPRFREEHCPKWCSERGHRYAGKDDNKQASGSQRGLHRAQANE